MDIIAQIREAILNGTLKPGDKLPAEKALMKNFGVSKHTLREALRAMEAMGFLEVRKGAGGGPVVLEVDMKTTRESISNFLFFQNTSIRDLSEVRRVIEPQLARLATERMKPEDLDALWAIHRSSLEAMGRGDTSCAHDMSFHDALARSSGNPVFMLIQHFVNSMLTDTKQRLAPGIDFIDEAIAAHEGILQAIRDRDPERVATEMYDHVCQVERSLEELQTRRNDELSLRVRNMEDKAEVSQRANIETI